MLSLAVSTYAKLERLADSAQLLNLAWTLDERELLAPGVDELLLAELAREISSGGELLHRYMVDDPYGERELLASVAGLFERPESELCLVAGAGVNSLLHGCARLHQRVQVCGSVYPDFPFWVSRFGGSCTELGAEPLAAGVVFLERPSLLGAPLDDLSTLRALCQRAQDAGAVLVVDESNASYCPPSFSAMGLLPEHQNLIVLRGLSKAFGMGALRVGYAVAASTLRERIRGVVPPLLASTLSLRLARRLLEAGDLAAQLRSRIAANKARVLELLGTAGLVDFRPAGTYLPYLVCSPDAPAVSALRNLGVQGKLHPIWAPGPDAPSRLFRVSVPLADARLALLEQRLRERGEPCCR